MKREQKVQQGKQVRSVPECARYTKMHIMHNILICRKLWYQATLWFQGC